MTIMSTKGAYVTLLTNEAYLAGIFVLNKCLLDVGSAYPLIVMTVASTPQHVLDILARHGIRSRQVQDLKLAFSPDQITFSAHDARLMEVWAKMRAFSLTEFDRVVLVDSDMIIRRNMDELMNVDVPKDWIAAAHVCACNPWALAHYPEDWIPENCAHNSINKPTQVPTYTDSSPRPYKLLNSGTVVLTPSKTTDAALERFFLHRNAKQIEKYTFRDQDLLADWFAGRWKPLPWYYNSLITLSHAHKPIWEDSEVRCLHYIGYRKPWAGRKAGDAKYQRFVDWWWTIFDGLEEELSDYPADWELLLRNTTPSG